MRTGVKFLDWLEDEILKVEKERQVSWQQWIALARVIYFLLREWVKEHDVRNV